MMKPNKKTGSNPPLSDFLKIEDDLPPLDHDEIHEPDSEEMASFLTESDETEAESDLDGEEDLDGDSGDSFGRDSLSEGEESWVEQRGESDKSEGEMIMEDVENDWAAEEESNDSDLAEDWFEDEDDVERTVDDGGMEGPVDDKAEIDEASWAELNGDSDDEDMKSPAQSLESLGIESPASDEDGLAEVAAGLILDLQILGPRRGGVAAASFVGGSPVGVGDGMFVLGADEMLHSVTGARILAQMRATSICSDKEAVFIGTERGGAFITRDRGKSLGQINGWCAQGLQKSKQTTFEHVSTSFELSGDPVPYGYRLIGLTGDGQIFVSFDYGRLWRRVAVQGHCLRVSGVPGSDKIFALVSSKNGQIGLFRSGDLESWERMILPDKLAAAAAKGSVSMAAGGETIVMATDDPSTPLFRSLDCGSTWMPVNTVKSVTAIAIDPYDPGWVAAAVYNASQDAGMIRASQDGGQTWQTVYRLAGADEDGETYSRRDGGTGNRISSISVNAGRKREVIAVTDRGAHLLTLARPWVSH